MHHPNNSDYQLIWKLCHAQKCKQKETSNRSYCNEGKSTFLLVHLLFWSVFLSSGKHILLHLYIACIKDRRKKGSKAQINGITSRFIRIMSKKIISSCYTYWRISRTKKPPELREHRWRRHTFIWTVHHISVRFICARVHLCASELWKR